MHRIHVLTILAVLAAVVCCGVSYAAQYDQAKLIDVLKSSAPAAEKALGCKQLAICGNQEAVPALAALLPDRELSSWARIALEAIPGESADAALREAMGKLQGRLLVGVINSLGVRRDAKAVDALIARLKDADADVASVSALALGHIGGNAAAQALEASLATAPEGVRSAVAEGCILSAERANAAGKTADAVRIYRAVAKAAVPVQRVLEATRGLILVQGSAGLPLLREQLQATEKCRLALGLRVARELPGPEVTEMLIAELSKATPQRQALLVLALADRGDKAALPAVLQVAKAGEEGARSAALRALKQLGDAACVPVLLEVALDANEEVAQMALAVLVDMPGAEIDKDLAGRLLQAEGKSRQILIDLAGRRPIVGAAAALRKAADDPDASIRAAALTALGATVEFADLHVLIQRVAQPRDGDDPAVAVKALATACQRMEDREAATAKLIAAMSQASVPVKCRFLEILTGVGGQGALQTLSAAVKDVDPQLQDSASRLLGEWMDVEVAPVLLDLAKNAAEEKYRIRALRGYIRLVRQFDLPDAERAQMCRAALETAQRPAEKKLVLEVIGRYPSAAMLSLALEATKVPELKNEAVAVALIIADKTGSRSAELQKMLGEMGHGTVKIEIVKAEYGAGNSVKDVTTILRKHVHDFPVIVLPSPSYNATFGGDPAPGVVKQLKVQYRMAGKPGEVSLPENASIVLPMPK
jgi:HEAT repeat protein